MATGPAGWCKSGLGQQDCVSLHVREHVPRARDGGKNRVCPVCDANLSLNPATEIPEVWLIGHCFGGCADEEVRNGLLGLGIDEKCLGKFGRTKRINGTAIPRPRASSDPTTLAAARRSYAYAKLVGAETANGSLLKMCIQAISEGDGDLVPDLDHLLPNDFGEFIELAKRTGIERKHRYVLANRYLSR